MAGVIGTRRFAYDVWGDTVNIAARLEAAVSPIACSRPRRR
jgi:class 3 adenylate cyclase